MEKYLKVTQDSVEKTGLMIINKCAQGVSIAYSLDRNRWMNVEKAEKVLQGPL